MLDPKQEHSEVWKQFGIGFLNINDAAALVAKCLLLQGELGITPPEGCHSIFYPKEKLRKLLDKPIAEYSKRFITAINDNSLKAHHIKRDIDNNPMAEDTYIHAEEMYNWLAERGVDLGEWFQEYRDFEGDLFGLAWETIEAERIKRNDPDYYLKKHTNEPFYNENEITFLKEKLRRLEEEPLSKTPGKNESQVKRKLNNVLKLLYCIAAEGFGYKHEDAKSPIPGELVSYANLQGIKISKGVVRTYLKEGVGLAVESQE